jgi:hypothetical protein
VDPEVLEQYGAFNVSLINDLYEIATQRPEGLDRIHVIRPTIQLGLRDTGTGASPTDEELESGLTWAPTRSPPSSAGSVFCEFDRSVLWATTWVRDAR